MIEYINLIGISDEVIDEILDKLGYDIALSMACNYKKIRENINILKSIGITNINNLLLNKNEVFFIESSDLINKLSNINISNFVELVNNDYNAVDEILI